MEKKYIIRDFGNQKIIEQDGDGWYCLTEKSEDAYFFDSIEDAETVIKIHNGIFQIESVYIN